MVFGKQKQINKRETVKESPVIQDRNEIEKLQAEIEKSKKEIKELEKETSDKPEQETTEEETTKEETEVEPEEVKTEEKKEYLQVVKELPQQQIRQHIDEETGVVTNFITVEEALTKIMGEI